MGCSSSKNIDAQLAGDFFGNESEHKGNNNSFSWKETPEGASNRSGPGPESKSILQSSQPTNNGDFLSPPSLEDGKNAIKKNKKTKSKPSPDDDAEFASPTINASAPSSLPSARASQPLQQQQQQQPQHQPRVRKNRGTRNNNNNDNIGSLNSRQKQQLLLQQQGNNQISPDKQNVKLSASQNTPNSRKNQPITQTQDNNGSSFNPANEKSLDGNTANSKQRKSNYVAPPSSESFVVNPTPKLDASTKKGIAGPTEGNNSVPAKLPSPPQVTNTVPPPPPPFLGQPTVEATSATSAYRPPPPAPPVAAPPKPIVLDDDDFSVAPSLAVEMRSIVNHTFDDVYQRGKKLGFGAFAVVFVGTHRPTGAVYAVKQVDRSKMFWGDRDALKDEIINLQKVRAGPNIVQLYEVFEEHSYCYLVTELMPGGELFDRIIEKKTFSEKEARNAIRCVLEALQYMHERRVAHRDLKPENLLLKDPKGLVPVKLADFGFAKSIEKKNGCRTLCGTPGYLAPEILERFPAYDVKCDVWSVGVILFLLLGGYLPFDDEDEDKVFDRTRNGQYDFRPQFWRKISNGAKDLVTKCLTLNPNKRYSCTQCLEHEWMAVQDAELATRTLDLQKLKNALDGKRKMKLAINTLVAANRMKQLNDDFSNYLDKRRQESIVSNFSYLTTGTKSGHAKFTEDSPSGKPFKDFYVVGELLGEGGHSYIHRCIRKSTKLPYAVKRVQLSKLDKKGRKSLKDEVAALKLLRGGPHIIRLFDVFEEKDDTYLIFEEMKGGNLLARIVEKEVYTEREARQVCKIAFMAINYCHKKKVAVRDIKPENFLLVEEGDDTSVKIVDFAFAKRVTHENCLKTLCGTAHYVAPEILDTNVRGYDHRCDIWSLGVFAYVLLGGYPPFEGILEDLAKEIMRGYYEFHEEYWSEISDSAKQMIAAMLVVNPAERISAADALSCKWMEAEEEQLILRDLSGAQESIRKTLQPTEKVKMAVTAIIARNKLMSIAGMFDQSNGTPMYLQESMGMIDEWEDEKFGDCYLWGEQIGVGTFSVVHEVMNKKTQEVYAAKRVSRKDLHPSDAVALHDEVAALQKVADCEHIVRLYDVYDEPDFTFLVLECMKGGDLIDRIIEKRHYTEFDAKEVTRKLIMGVAYCHSKKIANRNLKPENLLLKAGSDTDVKISDFGYAKTVTFPNSLRTQCGTEGYVAPEILEHRPAYDVHCDMWSLGVIVYIVLGGYRPFRGEGEDVMRQIRYGDYKFHKRYWSHVSDDAKNLISRMLTVDCDKRITAEAALRSRWIQADAESLGTELSSNMTDLKNLRNAKRKIKGVVNTIIATNKLQGGFHDYKDC